MTYPVSPESPAYDLAALLPDAVRALGPGADAWPSPLSERLSDAGYGVQSVTCSLDDALVNASETQLYLTCRRASDGAWVGWLVGPPATHGRRQVWQFGGPAPGRKLWGRDEVHSAVGLQAGHSAVWLLVQPLLLLKPLQLDADDVSASPERRAWSRLARLALTERTDLGWVLVYAILSGLLALTVPAAVQTLVNTVAFTALLQPLIVLAVIFGAALTYGAVSRCLQVVVIEHLQQRLFVRVAADFVRRLPRLARGHADPTLVHRYFEFVALQKTTATLLVGGLDVVLQTAIGIVVLAFYHPWLLAIDALLIALLGVALLGLGRVALSTSLRESDAKYALAATLHHLASGEPASMEAADRGVEAYLVARARHFRIALGQHILCTSTGVLTSVLLLGVGGWLVLEKQLSLGKLVAAEIIVAAIASGTSKLGKHAEALYDLLTSVEKLGKIVDKPLVVAEVSALPTPSWPPSIPPATSPAAKFGRWSLYLMPVFGAVLLALPWQQSARGDGRVIAYAPVEREQAVEAPIDGRVVSWSVQEGSPVKAGDRLVDLMDNDPNLL
ncbi:MAG TPA: biotin/lipoyl-binding protein, partial [Myxococcota bacterium]|nr:biotin/lipoyl-binding protein [Myxococcota bacterium]